VLRRDERERSTAKRRADTAARRAGSSAVDPVRSAQLARLTYVDESRTAGIRRLGKPGRFRYVNPRGKPVDASTRQRVLSLVIPPAWTNVWISPDPRGHLQATGRDAKGRKQYRYHPRWREVRDETKYGRLLSFAEALPAIRARTKADLSRHGLSRARVLAAIVQLLEKTLIRVGNEEYARANHSYGLTTLRDAHAKTSASSIRFVFRGKSGKGHEIALTDRRLARIVKACRDLPGQELFQYVDERGRRRRVNSADVNEYVRSICGEDFTAKDFRTWAGTVLAATTLAAGRQQNPGQRPTKRSLLRAIESVAERLGNTRAVCRKSYIHPVILDAFMEGDTIHVARMRRASSADDASLSAEEQAVVNFLQRHLTVKNIA